MKAVTKLREKKAKIDASDLSLEEKLLGIDRVTKVVIVKGTSDLV
jgi:hypothetical protein